MTHIYMIGCGHMGTAMAERWLEADADIRLTIIKPSPPEGMLGKHARVQYSPSLCAIESQAGIAILAVKPPVIIDILPDVARYLQPDYIMTIAAGLRMAAYRPYLGDVALLRAMPNMPVRLGKGVTTIMRDACMHDLHYQHAHKLLRLLGTVCEVQDESLFDVTTALAGSGPAYLYYIMECLIDAAMHHGLDAQQSRQMVTAMCDGAAAQAAADARSPAALRDAVTSKGGTTQAALNVMMRDNQLRNILTNAIDAAITRAGAMGRHT